MTSSQISGPSERKRQTIQAAGAAVFLERGYEAASMDLIATEAKVSKQTIYNHFRSKDELFKAIIMEMTTALVAPLSVSEVAASTPQKLLQSFALDFLKLMLQPSSLAIYRLIVAESARFPELGAALYAAGAGHLIHKLADYLKSETKRGRLAIKDAEQAAELFVGMLAGRLQLRVLLGDIEAPTDAELGERAKVAVSSFITLFGPPAHSAVYKRPIGPRVTQ